MGSAFRREQLGGGAWISAFLRALLLFSSLALLSSFSTAGVGLPLDSGTVSRAVPRAVWRFLAAAVAESNSRKLGICGVRLVILFVCFFFSSLFSLKKMHWLAVDMGSAQLWLLSVQSSGYHRERTNAGGHETPTGSRSWSNLKNSQVGTVCPSQDILAACKLFFAPNPKNLLD